MKQVDYKITAYDVEEFKEFDAIGKALPIEVRLNTLHILKDNAGRLIVFCETEKDGSNAIAYIISEHKEIVYDNRSLLVKYDNYDIVFTDIKFDKLSIKSKHQS